MKLPFLDNDSRWPTMKEPEERVVNPSYDRQIQDRLVDELLIAMEKKDHTALIETLHALCSSFVNEETGE